MYQQLRSLLPCEIKSLRTKPFALIQMDEFNACYVGSRAQIHQMQARQR
jgi:hypothetical protein